jgi:hypothetical protein
MGQFSILKRAVAARGHLCPQPLFPTHPGPPIPLPRLRGHQALGNLNEREGRAARCQADGPGALGRRGPSGRQTRGAPSPLLPSPSIFRSITVHCWVWFPHHSLHRKTDRVPPSKASLRPRSCCVGACALPKRHDTSELSNKWISRLHHVSKGRGGKSP